MDLKVNDLVEYVVGCKSEIRIGKIQNFKKHKKTKEIYLVIGDEYAPSKKADIILEDDVIRKLPLRENRHFHIYAKRNKLFVHQIQGYPRQIIKYCDNAKVKKEFMIARNYKDAEFKNMFYSKQQITRFDENTYFAFFKSFKHYNPTNVLILGSGDIRLLFNIFLDFNRFQKLKKLKIIEIDIRKFLKMEAMFDALIKILKTNWNLDRFEEYYFVKKVYAKRDCAVPIKMILIHKQTNRCIVFYRQSLWNILDNKQPTKYQLICNWLQFENECEDNLYQNILKPKLSKMNCTIITVKKMSKKSRRALLMYKCGKMNVFHPTETVYAYTKCIH